MREVRPQRNSKKKSRVTLLGTIANGSTGNARRLLQKYDYPDANGYDDLELKLTQLYHSTEDKKAIEKDLAEIHPHKDFILKYCPPNQPTETTSENLQIEKISNQQNSCGCGNPYCPSNYGGSCSAIETQSNACGCSGVDGTQSNNNNSGNTDKSLIISASMIGLFTLGIISIFALSIKRN
jgi:hypothetical protein